MGVGKTHGKCLACDVDFTGSIDQLFCSRKCYFSSGEYRSWCHMRQRCLNVNNDSYHRYGGRGIMIHQSWESFRVFLSDMGKKPTSQHTLDRINTNDNYEPSNCRWATRFEQCNNQSDNRVFTVFGVKYPSLYAMARAFKMNPKTLQVRIDRAKWSVEKAVSTPVISRKVST